MKKPIKPTARKILSDVVWYNPQILEFDHTLAKIWCFHCQGKGEISPKLDGIFSVCGPPERCPACYGAGFISKKRLMDILVIPRLKEDLEKYDRDLEAYNTTRSLFKKCSPRERKFLNENLPREIVGPELPQIERVIVQGQPDYERKPLNCRAYRCKKCLPDAEIWVVHHDDSKEHFCQWCGNKTKYIREVPKRKAALT